MNIIPKLEDTGERMVPEFHKGSLIYGEHLTRYISTEKIIRNKIILDIASGSGYGSYLMAKNAKKVYGVDVNTDAITYAQKNYNTSNLEYIIGDGERIPLGDNSVDVVVSFETIEHIKDYLKFIKEMQRVLKPGGIIILSTPNDLEFAEGNHFHLHEFTYQELYSILKKEFSFIDSYYQGTWKYVSLGESSLFNTEGQMTTTTLNLAPLKPEQYLYFFLVCSNNKINDKIASLGAVSEHYSDKQQLILEQNLQNTTSSLGILRSKYDELSQKLTDEANNAKHLQNEIDEIKNSRAYKLALKARALKSKVIPK